MQSERENAFIRTPKLETRYVGSKFRLPVAVSDFCLQTGKLFTGELDNDTLPSLHKCCYVI